MKEDNKSSMGSWAAVLDEGKCSLCEVCANKCPTASLSISRTEESEELIFDPRICDDCGGEPLCQKLCPEEAIVIKANDSPEAYARGGRSADLLAKCSRGPAERPEDGFKPVLAANSMAASAPVILIRGALLKCQECGTPFVPGKKIETLILKEKVEEKEIQKFCPDCRRKRLLLRFTP